MLMQLETYLHISNHYLFNEDIKTLKQLIS